MRTKIKQLVNGLALANQYAASTLHKIISTAGALGNSSGYDRWLLHDSVNRAVQCGESGSVQAKVVPNSHYHNAVHISSDGEMSGRVDYLVAYSSNWRGLRRPEFIHRPLPMWWQDGFGTHNEQFVIDPVTGAAYFYRVSPASEFAVRLVAKWYSQEQGETRVGGWLVDPAVLRSTDSLIWCEGDEKLNKKALSLLRKTDNPRGLLPDETPAEGLDAAWTVVIDRPDLEQLAQDIIDLWEAAQQPEPEPQSPSYDEDDDDDEYLGVSILAKLRAQKLEWDEDED